MTHPNQQEPSLIEIPTNVVADAVRAKLWHQGLDVRSIGFYGEQGQLLDLGRIYIRAYKRQDIAPPAKPPKAPLHIGRVVLWVLVVILTGNLIYAALKSFL